MNQRLLICTSLCFLLLATFSPCRSETVAQQVAHIVDSVYSLDPDATGILVHIEAPDQQISWSYATGRSNRNTAQKLLANQPLLIAGNTKPYVAATILRLVEQGSLNLDQPIGKLLVPRSLKLLNDAGYRCNDITVKQLLSHTSGIRDYVDEGYLKFVSTHRNYQWTRDEQIARAAKAGGPLAAPGDSFRYADINYLLLTEIIERQTKMPFYDAMRSLLDYKKLHLDETWFAKLEPIPVKTFPRAHQYWDEFRIDAYDVDPSWDLYGGGGMLSTMKEMALFFQYLFDGSVFKDNATLSLMTHDVHPIGEVNYCLGVRKISVAGKEAYNHGGGLGTDVIYIPELHATVAVAALEAGHRSTLMLLREAIVKQLMQGKI